MFKAVGNNWVVSYCVTHLVLSFQIISLKPLRLPCFSLCLCQEHLPTQRETALMHGPKSLVPRTDAGLTVLPV